MEKLITLRSFNSSSELDIAMAYLESNGIECFSKDEIMSRTYVSNVVGGAKLQVKEEQLEDAIARLIEGGYLKKENLEPSPEFKFIDKILSKFRK